MEIDRAAAEAELDLFTRTTAAHNPRGVNANEDVREAGQAVSKGGGSAGGDGVGGRRGGSDDGGGGNGVGEGEGGGRRGRRGGDDGADFSGDSEALLGRQGFAQGVGLEPGEIGDAEC